MSEVTLVTPCHARDLERFRLQRESIERCGIVMPHTVVVDHEDLEQFRNLPHMSGVTLVSTRGLLSRSVEARRRGYKLRRRQPEWWGCRRFGKPVHGWGIQQIIKLAAPRVVTNNAYVCIDCDTFFVGRVTAAEFLASDGRPLLYETADDLDAEMAAWPAASMRFLGVKSTGKALYRYTHSPVVMRRDVVLDLQRHIEAKHRRSWDAAFLDAGVMEYTTYGVYAREIDVLRRVLPSRPSMSCYFWWPHEVEVIQAEFAARIVKSGAKIIGAQSNTGCGVEAIRVLAEPLWSGVETVGPS